MQAHILEEQAARVEALLKDRLTLSESVSAQMNHTQCEQGVCQCQLVPRATRQTHGFDESSIGALMVAHQ